MPPPLVPTYLHTLEPQLKTMMRATTRTLQEHQNHRKTLYHSNPGRMPYSSMYHIHRGIHLRLVHRPRYFHWRMKAVESRRRWVSRLSKP
jgi:hypothetical protein